MNILTSLAVMDVPETPTLDRSRWSKRTGRLIEVICFLLLMMTIGTVVYGLMLRAFWADGYYVVIALVLFGAIVMMLSLAQQAIAARDAATWRAMAEWQIRAARSRIMGGGAAAGGAATGKHMDFDPESPLYYEHLVEALLDHVQHDEKEEPAP